MHTQMSRYTEAREHSSCIIVLKCMTGRGWGRGGGEDEEGEAEKLEKTPDKLKMSLNQHGAAC